MIARASRELVFLLVLALLPAVISGAVQLKRVEHDPSLQVEVAKVRSWGDNVLLVDARPRREFEADALPGAILLNEDEWNALIPAFLNAWDPDKPIVVYCGGGGCQASKAVAARLKTELQLENVHVLRGGLRAWRSE